ncbi:MAG: tryptophan synthase subunit alpha [Armatimonadota bacterium]|nr:tryptophan synthase subunit alpha [Armatimonadota bacterium]
MERIHRAFERANSERGGALIIYVTAGDPSLEETAEIVLAAERGGADIIELGIPFAAPTADGPTIQAACKRALAADTTPPGVLETAGTIREQSDIPLVLMTCYNPVLAYGIEEFARDAVAAGVDGALISDLPPAEAGPWVEAARTSELGTVLLVAPGNSDRQIDEAVAITTGFVYVISRPGVTGAREDIYEGLRELVNRVKARSDVPVAVGFGLSTGEQVAEVLETADGAVVGSAVVNIIAEGNEDGTLPERVEEKVRELRG